MEDNTCKIGEKFSGAWARRNGWGTLGIYRAATICRAFTGRPLFSQHPPSLLIALWPAAFFVLFSPLHCRIRLLLFEVVTDGGELCCPADIWRFWVNCGDPWNQLHQLGRKAFYNKPGLASLISFTTALWASPELIRFLCFSRPNLFFW